MVKNSIHSKLFIGFEIANIAASIIFNLLLIYLILFRSSREIGAYRYLLFAFTINNIYYPIVHLLTLPVICTYKDAFIMFAHGILTSRFAISYFASSHSHTMPLLAHLFIYRLFATKWPSLIRFYSRLKCYFLVSITLCVEGALWFWDCYYGFGSDQETRDYVQPLLDDEFDGEGKEFIGALYYGANGTLRVGSVLATMGLNAIMAFFMLIIAVCSFVIIGHFQQNHVELSDKTRTMQRQLFRILVAQMVFPIVFVSLPCAAIINLPMFGVHLIVYPNLTSASLSIFPVIDALVIMFGVRSYRKTILHWLKRGSGHSSNGIVTPNGSANQQSSPAMASSHNHH